MRLTPVLGMLALLAGTATAAPDYVGSGRCAGCHEAEAKAWVGSHHDLAMKEANEETVLGDFSGVEFTAHGVTSRFYRGEDGWLVRTDGPDGKLRDYPVRYTFGWFPLQQYLVEFPGGRLQSLGIAWDSRPEEEGGQRWFHLYPDEKMDHGDPLHWTSPEQTWNYQCAECHSTDLKKRYDLERNSYDTTWAEINVACEACHGPGSGHLEWAEQVAKGAAVPAENGKGLVVDLADRDGGAWRVDPASGKPKRSMPRTSRTQIELCARCHSRRGQIWEGYEYGKPLANTHRLALLEDHLYFPDGQIKDEVYVYGSFVQSRMYRAGVTCRDCHEPHSLKLRAEGDAVCGSCHLASKYAVESHHRHPPSAGNVGCVDCHMPQRTYMVVDDRADHSMRVPRPDLSRKLGTPNACNQCHRDKSSQWAADAVTEWFPESPYRGSHFGEALHAAASRAPDAGARLRSLAIDGAQPGIARATAIDRLRDHAESVDLSSVGRLLADEDPWVRSAALRFLELADVRTRVDMGWPLLDDPDRAVRLDAARLLAPLMRQRVPEKFRQELERAIAEYRQAQMVNADRPEAHLNLGLLAVAVGDYGQAENSYRRAVRLDPTFSPGFVNLADLYRQLGRDSEGEPLLRSAIDLVPKEAGLHHAMGLLLVRQKRLPDAVGYLKRAMVLAPEQPRYGYVYALALQGLGDTATSMEVLEQINAGHPGNREVLLALVTLHRDLDDRETARRYAEELLRRHPSDPQLQDLVQNLRRDGE